MSQKVHITLFISENICNFPEFDSKDASRLHYASPQT